MTLEDVKKEIKEGVKTLKERKKEQTHMEMDDVIQMIELFYLLVDKIE